MIDVTAQARQVWEYCRLGPWPNWLRVIFVSSPFTACCGHDHSGARGWTHFGRDGAETEIILEKSQPTPIATLLHEFGHVVLGPRSDPHDWLFWAVADEIKRRFDPVWAAAREGWRRAVDELNRHVAIRRIEGQPTPCHPCAECDAHRKHFRACEDVMLALEDSRYELGLD